MAKLLLNLQNIRLTFGGKPVLDGAELMLADDERMCLVGRNGSGKSTLLKIAAGMIEPDDGEVWLHAKTGEPMGLRWRGQRIRIIPSPSPVKS